MKETFSSDLEDVCKSIHKTLEDSHRFLIEEMGSIPGQFSDYKVLQKYKYDDGKPFVLLSRRYYHATRIFDFGVMFDVEWYNNATNSQLKLISHLTLNVKNIELDTPIFMYCYTFNNRVIGTDSHYISTNLNVNYDNCIIKGSKDRYHSGKYVKFDNCVFILD